MSSLLFWFGQMEPLYLYLLYIENAHVNSQLKIHFLFIYDKQNLSNTPSHDYVYGKKSARILGKNIALLDTWNWGK